MRQVAGGLANTLAVLDDGSVWARGDKQYSQLGEADRHRDFNETAQLVDGLPGMPTAIAGANGFVLVRWEGDCSGTVPRATLELYSSRNCITVYSALDKPQIEPPVADTPPTALRTECLRIWL